MFKKRIRAMPRALANTLYLIWLALIVGVFVRTLTDSASRGAESGLPPIRYVGQSLTVKLLDGGDEAVLFVRGHSYAVAFVSANCEYCRDRAAEISGTLRRIPTEYRVIVSLDDSATATEYRRQYLGPHDTVAIPVYQSEVASFAIRSVPTFAVIDETASLRLVYADIPPKEVLGRVIQTLNTRTTPKN